MGGAQNLSRLGRQVSRNSWHQCWRNVSSVLAPLMVSAHLIICVAFSPSHSISLVRLFTHPVVMTHAPLFVTAHHVLTLSRSHTISLYALSHCLALSRSHTESRSLSHQLPHMHGIFLCQRLTSSRFIPHTSYCVSRDRTIQRTDTEPRTVRRTIQRTGNAHCCHSNCYCAHTLLCRPLLHYYCTIQHTAHHSTPLITATTAALILHHTAHHSSHRPMLHQTLLDQPLLHRPLLHRPLLH